MKITWEMLILETLLDESPSSSPVSQVLPIRQDLKSSAHCKMFWMMLAIPCVSLDKKHLQRQYALLTADQICEYTVSLFLSTVLKRQGN